jgi:hypothetical protein
VAIPEWELRHFRHNQGNKAFGLTFPVVVAILARMALD